MGGRDGGQEKNKESPGLGDGQTTLRYTFIEKGKYTGS